MLSVWSSLHTTSKVIILYNPATCKTFYRASLFIMVQICSGAVRFLWFLYFTHILRNSKWRNWWMMLWYVPCWYRSKSFVPINLWKGFHVISVPSLIFFNKYDLLNSLRLSAAILLWIPSSGLCHSYSIHIQHTYRKNGEIRWTDIFQEKFWLSMNPWNSCEYASDRSSVLLPAATRTWSSGWTPSADTAWSPSRSSSGQEAQPGQGTAWCWNVSLVCVVFCPMAGSL
jgi:hypothetical protein